MTLGFPNYGQAGNLCFHDTYELWGGGVTDLFLSSMESGRFLGF
jgi:hypothetical protein